MTGKQTVQTSVDSSSPQAPAPNPNAKRYTVTGTVFNSITNEPLRRVLIRVSGGSGQHVAFTGNDGRFEIANVVEGDIWMSAERPGYFDSRALDTGATIPAGLKVGAGSNDFRLYLIPESKIVGTVLSTDGDPVEGVSVQAIREQIVEGRSQWIGQGSAQTDENGIYRLESQMPGAVIVCTMARPIDQFEPNSSEAYAGHCYPNSPDAPSAQPISLQAGQVAHADFSLETVRLHLISGVISGMRGGQVQGFVQQQGSDTYNIAMDVNSTTGRFVARSIPSGNWKVVVQNDDANGRLEAVQDVTVGGSDVTGLQIVLMPGLNIPVEESFGQTAPASVGAPAGAASVRPALAQLRLLPSNFAPGQVYGMSRMPNGNGPQNGESTLTVQNVSPGSYRVVAQAAPGCVASITYGNADVSREPLTVVAGTEPQPLVVALRLDCASLNVTVESDRKDAQGVLIVVPELPIVETQLQSIHAGSPVQVSGLAPGSYRLYAVSSVGGLAYADSQAMRDIPSQTINLDANANSQVTLQLYEREK